jgi:hypothetical protein
MREIMKKEQKKKIKTAEESLEEILRRIKPFMPKTPEAKESPKSEWKLISNGELPPLNSTI